MRQTMELTEGGTAILMSLDPGAETLKMSVTERDVVLEMELEEGGSLNLPYYEGSYDITPKVIPQKMETKNRAMREDVLIRQIPYEAVSNGTGTTITIGGY